MVCRNGWSNSQTFLKKWDVNIQILFYWNTNKTKTRTTRHTCLIIITTNTYTADKLTTHTYTKQRPNKRTQNNDQTNLHKTTTKQTYLVIHVTSTKPIRYACTKPRPDIQTRNNDHTHVQNNYHKYIHRLFFNKTVRSLTFYKYDLLSSG